MSSDYKPILAELAKVTSSNPSTTTDEDNQVSFTTEWVDETNDNPNGYNNLQLTLDAPYIYGKPGTSTAYTGVIRLSDKMNLRIDNKLQPNTHPTILTSQVIGGIDVLYADDKGPRLGFPNRIYPLKSEDATIKKLRGPIRNHATALVAQSRRRGYVPYLIGVEFYDHHIPSDPNPNTVNEDTVDTSIQHETTDTALRQQDTSESSIQANITVTDNQHRVKVQWRLAKEEDPLPDLTPPDTVVTIQDPAESTERKILYSSLPLPYHVDGKRRYGSLGQPSNSTDATTNSDAESQESNKVYWGRWLKNP